MKTNIQCPHCHGKHVNPEGKTTQIIFGLVMVIIGLGFLTAALTHAVGYYLFALPLCTVGCIRIGKSYYSHETHAQCEDCQHEFEYIF
ncbi:hypothetical protein HQ865_11760 [Mucilaginibacter mali]|uniref:Uncharacterized protein n=1 Tax=Mucilaginibacter mali TaxID=2740462 RepID=A0A7D4PUJ5_9SPHI|nr:hypothetical protein [Mucilaginibacter mali]QKJ30403.1 hypothetical protein HQ865_11760 [Mucilaginibacter mali]